MVQVHQPKMMRASLSGAPARNDHGVMTTPPGATCASTLARLDLSLGAIVRALEVELGCTAEEATAAANWARDELARAQHAPFAGRRNSAYRLGDVRC